MCFFLINEILENNFNNQKRFKDEYVELKNIKISDFTIFW